MEEFINNFMFLTSTCLDRAQCHDKTNGHKRFSNSGKLKHFNCVFQCEVQMDEHWMGWGTG